MFFGIDGPRRACKCRPIGCWALASNLRPSLALNLKLNKAANCTLPLRLPGSDS
jgi:hypothetical protein